MQTAFQYMSDLHLEMSPDFEIRDVRAPHLILAGDIGAPRSDVYARFLRRCSAQYSTVCVVLGNHECYGGTVAEATAAVERAIVDLPNVHLLNRTRHDQEKGGIRVIGTTLWSDVPPERCVDVRCFIQDFRRILGWGVGENNAAHLADVRWIEAEMALADVDGVRLVVVTHHAPLLRGTSDPAHEDGPLNCAFASDLRRLVRPPVSAWIHGHTHFSHFTEIGGTVVAANQRGYNCESVAFDQGAVVIV